MPPLAFRGASLAEDAASLIGCLRSLLKSCVKLTVVIVVGVVSSSSFIAGFLQ